ncbi:MAG: metallophosphoesterase [Bacteroidia bacterium]|nr:metallophosphoesterase [Bacteroidia bacterium]
MLRVLILIIIGVLTEFVFHHLLKSAFVKSKIKKQILFINYGLIFYTSALIIIITFHPPHQWNHAYRILSALGMIVWFCKFLSVLFYILIKPFQLMLRFFFKKFTQYTTDIQNKVDVLPKTEKFSRGEFIEKTALAGGALMLGGFGFGMVKGAYHYKIHKVKIPFSELPESFHQFKILQISDLHIGSFISDKPLWKVSEIIHSLNPDIILFTGDIINNYAKELEGFEDVLKSFRSPMGVYSILGNHDYGDYVRWLDLKEKEKNFMEMIEFQKSIGWKLLRNENEILSKGRQSIALIGVENWSKRLHFPKYGNLSKAYAGTEHIPFKILMSHDPSHWDAEVLLKYADIQLTLSGHTHGFQFGIEIPGFKWSPVKYVYPHWAGLYKNGAQYLYVNRGLGFIGYPGRLGIWPEITLIELQKSSA